MVAGKVALVTGASRGIGLAIAAELLRCGASVCLTARRGDELDAALRALHAGDAAMAVAGNVDDPLHRSAAVAAVVDRFGALDVVVNNAGTSPQYGPLVAADLDAVRKTLSVNLLAALGFVQAAWSAWLADHGGCILNVASTFGLRATPDTGAYNVSKAALVALTRQLALELAPGVRVNAVAPGAVHTRFARAFFEGREQELAARFPLGRAGEPSDVAAVARFLVSSEASWITGETVVVDGGALLPSTV